MGSAFRPMTETEKALMQKMVEQGYDLFTTRCAEGRGMTQEQIDAIGQGRVWTGTMALERGLVDVLGGLDDAIEIAVKKAGIEQYTLKSYPEQEGGLLSMFSDAVKDNTIRQQVLKGDAAKIFNDVYKVSQLDKMDRIQARLPYNIVIK